MVCTYFLKGSIERDMHDGICNLEVLDPTIYKQYVHKIIKLLHTYIKFIPHPCSLDGTSPPIDEMLKEFKFAEVNTAIANALIAIVNTPATLPVPETS